jgi:hypothetical protein
VARVTVTPDTFTYVAFDAGRIAAIAEKVASDVGLGDADIVIEVDESTPLARTRVDSTGGGGEPVRLHVEGGAFEDTAAPQQLSEARTADVIGRLLYRVADRRSGRFDHAPADEHLSLQEQVAWDTCSWGRLARLGYDVQEPRRRYHFRTRHGFSDIADHVYERLWWAPDGSISWSDVAAACAETATVRP